MGFWMQTIYFDTYLGPKRAFGSKNRPYASFGYHLYTISYSNVFLKGYPLEAKNAP